jgi:hypothetical protein
MKQLGIVFAAGAIIALLIMAYSNERRITRIEGQTSTNTTQINRHAAIIKYMFKASQQTNHNTQVSTNK